MSLPPPIDPKNYEQFIGYGLEVLRDAVAEQGGVVRVVERDGAPLPTTLDYAPTRLNVAVDGPDELVVSIVGNG